MIGTEEETTAVNDEEEVTAESVDFDQEETTTSVDLFFHNDEEKTTVDFLSLNEELTKAEMSADFPEISEE